MKVLKVINAREMGNTAFYDAWPPNAGASGWPILMPLEYYAEKQGEKRKWNFGSSCYFFAPRC